MNNNPICNCIKVRTVQSPSALKQMPNTFVYVTSNNTTYFVSNKCEITIINSGNVYVDDYNYIQNRLNLRNQTCYDFANNRAIHYNAKGEYRITKLEEQ